jgi:hypothetical protein
MNGVDVTCAWVSVYQSEPLGSLKERRISIINERILASRGLVILFIIEFSYF